MSQRERHAKQSHAIAQQAAEQLRQQQALRPKPLAVYIVAAYGYMQPAWRSTLGYSPQVAELFRRAHPITKTETA